MSFFNKKMKYGFKISILAITLVSATLFVANSSYAQLSNLNQDLLLVKNMQALEVLKAQENLRSIRAASPSFKIPSPAIILPPEFAPSITPSNDGQISQNNQNVSDPPDGRIINPDGYSNNKSLVAFGSERADGNFQSFCAGSVLTPNWVLTAAHCGRRVERGVTQILWGHSELTHINKNQLSIVKDMFTHDKYRNLFDDNFDNDIALVYVEPPIRAPVMILDNNDITSIQENSSLIVMGWGSTTVPQYVGGTLKVTPSGRLAYITVQVKKHEDCKTAYAKSSPPQAITARMFCAAAPNKDACAGDSGGPILKRNSSGDLRQVGIVSFGESCALQAFPGVYTTIANFRPWLESTIAPPMLFTATK